MRRVAWSMAFALVGSAALLMGPFPGGWAQGPGGACLSCHGLEGSGPPVDLNVLADSVHGELGCGACHPGAQEVPHPATVRATPGRCGACHVEVADYERSVHGPSTGKETATPRATCADCHGTHAIRPVSAPGSPVAHAALPETCGRCHPGVVEDYTRSIHWQGFLQGIEEVPLCTDCHREHAIRTHREPQSPVYAANVPQTCGACHENKGLAERFGLPARRYTTYIQSYHGLSLEYGNLIAANCASCHGAHRILPASDPRSTIYPDNRGQTCGQCHPNAGENFSKGVVHVEASASVSPGVYAVRLFYTVFISTLLAFFLLHIGLDVTRRLRRGGIK